MVEAGDEGPRRLAQVHSCTPSPPARGRTMNLGVSSQIFTLEGGALQIVENDSLV